MMIPSEQQRHDQFLRLFIEHLECWEDPDVELSLRSGDMPAGTLRLESGVAEFRFAEGATACTDCGTAGLSSRGERRQLSPRSPLPLATVPHRPTPASRITLITPATQVVDLGTEFAQPGARLRETLGFSSVDGRHLSFVICHLTNDKGQRMTSIPVLVQGNEPLSPTVKNLPVSGLQDVAQVKKVFDAAYPAWRQGDALVCLVGDTLTVMK